MKKFYKDTYCYWPYLYMNNEIQRGYFPKVAQQATELRFKPDMADPRTWLNFIPLHVKKLKWIYTLLGTAGCSHFGNFSNWVFNQGDMTQFYSYTKITFHPLQRPFLLQKHTQLPEASAMQGVLENTASTLFQLLPKVTI